jgi:nicotinamide mononucleotide transporter
MAGVTSGVLGVWLTTRQNVWCWPVGLVNVAVYAVVFHAARLYADMGLQAVYALIGVWGWYHWLRGGPTGGVLLVSRARGRTLLALALAGSAAAVVIGLGLAGATDARVPFWDATTTAFSLVASFMQSRKWLENWLLWIVVDGALVAKYAFAGLLPTACLFAAFLGLAVLGLVEWRRSLRRESAP